MASFGRRSTRRLATCEVELRDLFQVVVVDFDVTVLCGARGRLAQARVLRERRSAKAWPDSLHNVVTPAEAAELALDPRPLARAVDVAPWPLDWADLPRFHALGGYVLATAGSMGIKVRWGGLWDRPWEQLGENPFPDLPHFELI